jgi:hypothetical protein
LVAHVYSYFATHALWEFSSPITSDGVPEAVFEVDGMAPTFVDNFDATTLEMIYPGPVVVGRPWNLTGTPVHAAIVPPLAVPETGLVELLV